MALDPNILTAFGGPGYYVDPITGEMKPNPLSGGQSPSMGTLPQFPAMGQPNIPFSARPFMASPGPALGQDPNQPPLPAAPPIPQALPFSDPMGTTPSEMGAPPPLKDPVGAATASAVKAAGQFSLPPLAATAPPADPNLPSPTETNGVVSGVSTPPPPPPPPPAQLPGAAPGPLAPGGPQMGGAMPVGSDPTTPISPPSAVITPDAPRPTLVSPAAPPDTGTTAGKEDLVSFLKRHEGRAAKSHWDYKQYTGGYGSKADGPDEDWSQERSDAALTKDIATHTATVDAAAKAAGVTLSPNQQAALVSFDFNVGEAGEVIQRAKGDLSKIPAIMAEYTHAGGKELPGLVKRRREEGEMFNGQGIGAAPPSAAPSATPTAPTTPALAAAASFDPNSLRASQGDKLLALASGLLQGPNFGQGLGKGLAALNAMTEKDRENTLKGMGLQNQTEHLKNDTANKTGLLSVAQQKADAGDRKVELLENRNKDLAKQHEETLASHERLAAIRDPYQKQIAAASTKTEAAIMDPSKVNDSRRGIESIDTVLQNIDHAGVGPDLISRFQRAMTNALGIPIGSVLPKAESLTEKDMNTINIAMVKGLGIPVRSARELSMLQSAFASMNSNPEAAKEMLAKYRGEMSAQVAFADHFARLPEDHKRAIRTTIGTAGYANQWHQENNTGGAHQGNDPAAVLAARPIPTGSWNAQTGSGTVNGITVQRIQ